MEVVKSFITDTVGLARYLEDNLPGSPMTFLSHDKGLATEISWANKDYYGKKIGKIIRVLGNVENPYALAILEKPSLFKLEKIHLMADQANYPPNIWLTQLCRL